MLRRQIERYGKWLVVIAVLWAAGLATAGYILVQQRFPLPWEKRYTINAEFITVGGLNPPGLGQPVNVAGVRVGTIAKTSLRDGRALAQLKIDPEILPRVYRNARAVLVPNTPLKDMQIDVVPGGPPAQPMREGDVIPIAATTTPIDSDELTNALDSDTRAFFEVLVTGFDQGTRGRGRDFREVLKTLRPTSEQLASIGAALAARRVEMSRLVTNLRVLSQATAARDEELGDLVTAANVTLQTLAREEAPLRASLARLPGTLDDTRRALRTVVTFANELRPALDALQPIVERTPRALAATRPLLDDAEPIVRDQVRPLVREIQPLAADLGPATVALADTTPHLIDAFQVLNYTVNMLAFNPPGDDEGGLFWLAWFAHNANSVWSTQDAHGAVAKGLLLIDCASATALEPLLLVLIGGTLPGCP